jgi:sterol desaturase/sphingolipid hydroxylase (fatty acid hydroxylase superfamily)
VTILQSIVLTVIVYIGEHLLLTRRYGMRSSLQRLAGLGWAARTDLSFTVLYNPIFWWLPRIPLVLCGPGILYVLLGRGLHDLAWPGALAFVTGVNPLPAFLLMLICADLTRYWMHRLFHAVPMLWRLHRLHHGAPEMNIANGTRIALSEHFLNELAILLVFFAIFGLKLPETALLAVIIRNVIDQIQHSDLPWDYGPLGKIFVSPRFHRLHHSVDPKDYDSNYADILAVWDHLFRTLAPRYRTQPAVGSQCRVGLLDRHEEEALNRGMRSLLHATFPAHAGALWQRSTGVRRNLARSFRRTRRRQDRSHSRECFPASHVAEPIAVDKPDELRSAHD